MKIHNSKLEVFQSDDGLSFRFTIPSEKRNITLMTGWKGFLNITDATFGRSFNELYFNGSELLDEGIINFWKQVDQLKLKNE